MLGWWGSSAVLGYLAETPLLAFSDRLASRTEQIRLSAKHICSTDLEGKVATEPAAEGGRLRREIMELKNKVHDLTTSLDGVSQVLENRQVRELQRCYTKRSSTSAHHLPPGRPRVIGSFLNNPRSPPFVLLLPLMLAGSAQSACQKMTAPPVQALSHHDRLQQELGECEWAPLDAYLHTQPVLLLPISKCNGHVVSTMCWTSVIQQRL